MNVRLRKLLLISLIGLGSFQIAEARDPRVKPAKITDHGVKPAQKYKTAQAPKKVKYKKVKYKKGKQKKFKQAKFKQPKLKQPKHRA
ncbi:MAG TPA: hypothetical protein VK335_22965 [Bryobacteraceae bacterium]|nr:hypothetical protein [Bryobacteraceae bacterium]